MVTMENFRSHWLRLLLLLLHQLVISQSQTSHQFIPPPTACTSSHAPATQTGHVPSLPQLPLQYSMRVEANILQKSWTTEIEEHYDSIKRRASLSVTRNGTTVTSIFNFNTNERYDIFPNGTCNTDQATADFYGFITFDKKHKPMMATVNEVFRFGAKYNQTYVGKDTVRGIRVNHWTSCQQWDVIGAKFQMDYYFSDPDFTMAAGSEQIPVRAVLNGSAFNVGMSSEHVDGTHDFQHVYEFTSFRVGPSLNEEVFQIPPGIFCKGRSDADKPMPRLPDSFEMSMESVLLDMNAQPRQDYIRYDYNHKLVETSRSMVVPQGFDISKSLGGHLVTEDTLSVMSATVVEDFQTGLIYIMEKINNTCAVRKMPSTQMNLGMAHGTNLLTLSFRDDNGNNKFQYQGVTTVRQMQVNAWAMEDNDMLLEVYFHVLPSTSTFDNMVGMFIKNKTAIGFGNQLPKLFEMFPPDTLPLEGYPSNNGLPDTSTNYPSQSITGDQLAWGLQMERFLDQGVTRKMINVFHYTPLHTLSTTFQVSRCYNDDQISRILLVVMTSYDKDVLPNFAAFSNSIRDAIANALGVSVLQISNLVPLPLKHEGMKIDATKINFDLLGAAPVEGTQQKTMEQLKQELTKAVMTGIYFRVQYATHSKAFMVDQSAWVIDYDTAMQKAINDSIRAQNASQGGGPDSTPAGMTGQQNPGPDSRTTYSPGAVAGIAFGTFILGAVVCVGVLFVLYRRKHPGESMIPYQLTT